MSDPWRILVIAEANSGQTVRPYEDVAVVLRLLDGLPGSEGGPLGKDARREGDELLGGPTLEEAD